MPTDPNCEMQEFARLLMQRVRDQAIQECDMLLKPHARASAAERWRKAAQSSSPEVLLKEAIPDIVDNTLFHLLYAIDEGWLRLTYTAENGKVIDLNAGDRGELAGWLGGGEEGWTTTYSKERFFDDLAGLEDRLKF